MCLINIKVKRPHWHSPKVVKNGTKSNGMQNFLELLDRMELRLNEEKSHQVSAKEESFDFLGFTFRYDRSLWAGPTSRYWNVGPSQKSQKKVRQRVKQCLQHIGHFPPEAVAHYLNEILRGWLNYFAIRGISYPKAAKWDLRQYLKERLYRYYNRKSQRKSRLYRQQAFEQLVDKYGLIDPTRF